MRLEPGEEYVFLDHWDQWTAALLRLEDGSYLLECRNFNDLRSAIYLQGAAMVSKLNVLWARERELKLERKEARLRKANTDY